MAEGENPERRAVGEGGELGGLVYGVGQVREGRGLRAPERGLSWAPAPTPRTPSVSGIRAPTAKGMQHAVGGAGVGVP